MNPMYLIAAVLFLCSLLISNRDYSSESLKRRGYTTAVILFLLSVLCLWLGGSEPLCFEGSRSGAPTNC